MPYEIWRRRASGERFLVMIGLGEALAAAGPLRLGDDPRRALEAHANQRHNPQALLEIRHQPDEFEREFVLDKAHRAVRLIEDAPDSTDKSIN